MINKQLQTITDLQYDQVYPCLIKLGAHDLVVESCMNS